MKTKILLSLLVIGLAVALIGGATMAWFTDETPVQPAEFTAGTVVVNADEAPTIDTPEGKYFDNVNPGDCATVTWTIVNSGTKAIELRVKLSELWEGELPTDNVYYAPDPDSGWVMYDEDGELWLYYTGGPVPGTYGNTPEDERTVQLPIIVAFDGATTGNDYQGKEFTLSGDVYAIQASNGAPAAVWGDAWTTVIGDYDYDNYTGLAETYIDYFLTGPGANMPCWTGGGGDPGQDEYSVEANIVVAGGGSVNGLGSFKAGDEVELEAVEEAGFIFTGWSGYEGLPDVAVNGNVLTFTMPASAVTVTANFEAVPAPKYTVTVHISGSGGATGTVTGAGQYAAGEPVSLTAIPGSYTWHGHTYNYKFDKWTGYGISGFNKNNPYTFTMPAQNVEFTAHFKY